MAKRELYGVRRGEGDAVICKDNFDAFEGTPLDRILKKRGVTALFLTGAFFDQCVRATASGARQRGYEVAVVRDLSVGVAPDLAPCLRFYEQDGIKMLNMRDVLGILK
jgi:nicotinamidase-related amidase